MRDVEERRDEGRDREGDNDWDCDVYVVPSCVAIFKGACCRTRGGKEDEGKRISEHEHVTRGAGAPTRKIFPFRATLRGDRHTSLRLFLGMPAMARAL